MELWKRYPDNTPRLADKTGIQVYPVAFYHPDIGIIVDMAEFHPEKPDPWELIGDGSTVRPFAFYDLPPVPSVMLYAFPEPDGIIPSALILHIALP